MRGKRVLKYHAGRYSRSVVRDALRRHRRVRPGRLIRRPPSPASLNMLWVVIGAILVIFMQAGFALVETGFCRAKHAAHVVSTNFAIFGLGFIGFFFVGFPLAFGGFDMQATSARASASPSGSRLLGSGNWVFLWQGRLGAVRRRHRRRRCSPSSSTWSPSWTPWPRSRPGRWPSGGSGAAS